MQRTASILPLPMKRAHVPRKEIMSYLKAKQQWWLNFSPLSARIDSVTRHTCNSICFFKTKFEKKNFKVYFDVNKSIGLHLFLSFYHFPKSNKKEKSTLDFSSPLCLLNETCFTWGKIFIQTPTAVQFHFITDIIIQNKYVGKQDFDMRIIGGQQIASNRFQTLSFTYCMLSS